jgi:hypothetical protein
MNAFFQIISSKVDASTGIIRGVSVITEGPARGHKKMADATTLSQVKSAADSMGAVKVKVNHDTGFEAIVGALKNFHVDGQQLRADLHLIKSHELYPSIVELSSSQPETFGLSISFSGKHEKIDGVTFARCDELYSVDLVDAPAANPSGLFSVDSAPKDMADNLKEFFSEAVEFFKSSKAASAATAADEAFAKLKTDFSQLTADLATAKQTIDSLGKQIADKDAALKTKEDEHKTALEAKDKSVEELATKKANEICVKMGIPPIRVEKTGAKPADGDVIAQYEAILDPVAKTQFYRKNKAAFNAAWTEKHPQTL